ncbi:PilW family protein [Piscinibacter sakaiensis]|uniref:Type IV fimbrial biogenesis protein PilW n=1 Tax=Piscinibacter sakaiensis TaxID=1547922 RepID=A0A0K8NWN3_PISS1|nr:PilW family protein [Piscinibacter sakaiensis]GAP34812.1 hypothetical protein ISF6_0295 [Piscinibacter sakaiensis]
MCATTRRRDAHRRRQAGVSLIELMVALVIGLLAVLVITQVLLVFEGNKRTTTSGSDAQLTGTLALHTIQREVQMAGYGLSTNPAGLGCTIRAALYAANGGNRVLAPVQITDGGTTGLPDTLRIQYSSKASFSVPTRVTGDHPLSGAGSTEFTVGNVVGVDNQDLMVAVPATWSATDTCVAFRVNGTPSTPGASIAHATGDTNNWNTNLLTFFPTAGYATGSYLLNLGAGLVDRTYSISGGRLLVRDYDPLTLAAVTEELFPQVVNFQAFYGKDTDGNGSVDRYDTTTPTTAAGWAQVIALRIAVVVRSDQYERESEVTTAALRWDLGATPTVSGSGVAACGSSQCLDIPLNVGITDTSWKRYRYKLYDTVIPLRNVLWRT